MEDKINLELISLAIVDDLIDLAEEQGLSHVILEIESARWIVDIAKQALYIIGVVISHSGNCPRNAPLQTTENK